MKKLVIVIVVLIAIALIAPFGIGRVAEGRLNRGLDKLVEQAPYFKITERKWTGGWFTSQQVITVELAEPWASVFNDEALEKIFKDAADEAEAGDDAEAEADIEADAEENVAPPVAEQPAAAEPAPGADAPVDESAADEAGEDAVAESEPARFTVRNDVLHGPVLGFSGLGIARVKTHLELSEDVRKEIVKVFGEKPALEVTTRVGFFGGGTTTFKSEGRKLITENAGDDFSYETFKLSVGVSGNADHYDIDGKLPKVMAKGASGGEFSLTGLTLTGDGERVLGDLYDGEIAFKVEEVKILDAGKTDAMVIQDAHYIVDTRTKDDFVNVSAQMGTGVVKGGDLAAAGFDIKEVHYDLSFRHLHAPTLAKMVQSMRNMYATPVIDPAQADALVFAPLKEHGAELLKHNPEFGLDRIGLVTPEGEIVAKGVIKLNGATPEDFVGQAIMGLIAKLDADITVTADIKVVEKLPDGANSVTMAVDSGYAKREGDQLICHIVFKDAQLTVNGKPQAIPRLGPPPGSMGEAPMEEGVDPDAVEQPPQE